MFEHCFFPENGEFLTEDTGILNLSFRTLLADVWERKINEAGEFTTTKILVIDENVKSRSRLRKDLQGAHFDVITAENSKEGLALALLTGPDLILLDLTKPFPDDFPVYRQLKENTATRTIPVIFLAARECLDKVVADLELGVGDFILKPLLFEELQIRIHKILLLKEIYKIVAKQFRKSILKGKE